MAATRADLDAVLANGDVRLDAKRDVRAALAERSTVDLPARRGDSSLDDLDLDLDLDPDEETMDAAA